jgi:hypothetical protein
VLCYYYGHKLIKSPKWVVLAQWGDWRMGQEHKRTWRPSIFIANRHWSTVVFPSDESVHCPSRQYYSSVVMNHFWGSTVHDHATVQHLNKANRSETFWVNKSAETIVYIHILFKTCPHLYLTYSNLFSFPWEHEVWSHPSVWHVKDAHRQWADFSTILLPLVGNTIL